MNRFIAYLVLISILGITPPIFADTTFFSEDFNSSWSATIPPTGWKIFNDSTGSSCWTRDSAGLHWSDNHSGYAEISYEVKNVHQELDSLISPIINCFRYRNIVLRCSSYFRHHQTGYSAKIIGSIDGGQTYPYLIRDYYGEYFNSPRLETIDLAWAQEQASVRIAFVFSGNINNIEFWCLDNVSLTGSYVFDIDASCLEVIKPFTVQPAGLCTVQVRVANLGKSDLSNFSVRCSIVDPGGISVHTANGTIDWLAVHETTEIALLPAWSIPDPPPFKYHFEAWCEVTGDGNTTNDTIRIDSICIQSTELLKFCEDSPNAGENFPIGEQGLGVKFTPNYYPAQIRSVDCYLGASKSKVNYRYKIRIVDDDGIDSAPGTTLYETSIINGNPGWNTAYLFYDDVLLITSGSVYIFYIQVDDVPNAPLLFHDGTRTADAVYYKYADGSYSRDFPEGDWLIHLLLLYSPLERKEHDVRAVFISNPLNEYVRRPYNYQIKIKARIENFGRADESNFAVSCTVYTAGIGWIRYSDTETIPYLQAGKGTFVEFSPAWNLLYNESDSVIVRTHLLTDQDPINNRKSKFITNTVGKFTGSAENHSYAWYDSDTTGGPVYNWVDTNGAYLVTEDYADDEIFPLPPLPFSFSFYDTTYNTVYVSTNGYLTFTNEPSSPGTNESIPSGQKPNCAIYPFWDDLYLPNDRTAKIYRKLIGTAPNRALVVTWFNIARKYADDTNRLSFQVILRENSEIVFQYKDVTCGKGWADGGKSATVGLENRDGSQGLQYLFGSETKTINWPENKLSSGRAIKFYKPTYDVGALTVVNPKDTILPMMVLPQIRIKNFGTEIADTIQLFLSILPGYDTFEFVPRLLPGEERLIQLAAWDAYVGRYTVVCSTRFSHDQYFPNNIIQDSVFVSMWVLKQPIPDGPEIKKVQNGALTYSPEFNKIYALKGGNCNEFWCYDIETNTWESLPRMPLAPSNKRPKAGCALVSAGLYIYAFKGGNTQDFYAYHIYDKTWTQLPPVQDTAYTGRKYPKDGAGLAFGSDGLIYAILGNNTNVLIRYNPGNQTWSHVSQIPAERAPIRDGGSITHHNGILYIFQGGGSRNLWRYRIDDQQWINPTEPCTIPGKKNIVKSGGASTCQSGWGIIYFFIGGNKQTLWKYDINTSAFYPLTPIPLGPDPRTGKLQTKIKKGAALAATPIDLIYAFKSGKNNEFWAYAFWGDTMSKSNHFVSQTSEQCALGRQSDESRALPTTIISNLLPIVNLALSGQPISINYTLTENSPVNIKIYSTTGQLIRTLIDQPQLSGRYSVNWDGTDLNGQQVKGIYFIKGNIGNKQFSYKLIRI